MVLLITREMFGQGHTCARVGSIHGTGVACVGKVCVYDAGNAPDDRTSRSTTWIVTKPLTARWALQT